MPNFCLLKQSFYLSQRMQKFLKLLTISWTQLLFYHEYLFVIPCCHYNQFYLLDSLKSQPALLTIQSFRKLLSYLMDLFNQGLLISDPPLIVILAAIMYFLPRILLQVVNSLPLMGRLFNQSVFLIIFQKAFLNNS
ncbi:hypothetical protein FGO68_gene17240 [Halteria grandinella]|uniref:Uncharacterized protein n=1 Tax=Halteria grandinella TaxID=5974 RepID=A0A8J8T469_HALGN|nr:hypothetical protein FGO68_gene17240 [Halteria grandinella]